MRIRINAYNPGSQSARNLAESLSELAGRRVLRLREQTRFRPRANDVVINYGVPRAQLTGTLHCTYNRAEHVREVTNKRHFFELATGIEGIRIPEYSTQIQTARNWIEEGNKVCCRTNLTGHSADGLVLATSLDELVHAPLYTKYVPKRDEYRVHFVGDTITDVQRKARRQAVPDEEVNWQVRNHDNGFIYMRTGVTPQSVPQDVLQQAGLVARSLHLTFGSIDIIWHERTGATVLEVNTASGLEGTTLERFSRAMYAIIQGSNPVPWTNLAVPMVREDDEAVEELEDFDEEEEQQEEPEPEVPAVDPNRVWQLEQLLAISRQRDDTIEQYRQLNDRLGAMNRQILEGANALDISTIEGYGGIMRRVQQELENPQGVQAAPERELQVLL